MREMARKWVQPMVHPARRADVTLIDAILDMFERRNSGQFAGQIEALLARPDASALLPTIACPTLVLVGREDSWAAPAQHEEMAAMIPGSRLVIVENCGHMAPMECPDAIAGALLAWMRAPLPNDLAAPGNRPIKLMSACETSPTKEKLMNRSIVFDPPPRVAIAGDCDGAGRSARRRACRRPVQDRPHPAVDGTVRVDRQADRGRGASLHGEERRHGSRPQDRADRQGRYRAGAGDDQAHRAGARGAGQGERSRGLRTDATRARRRARRDGSEGADGRDGGRHRDDSDASRHSSCAPASRCRRSRRRSPSGR